MHLESDCAPMTRSWQTVRPNMRPPHLLLINSKGFAVIKSGFERRFAGLRPHRSARARREGALPPEPPARLYGVGLGLTTVWRRNESSGRVGGH